jgi:hypothetical protein
VTQLRFHRELYQGRAVDAAVKVYQPYARFELREEPTHWVVEVSADDAARERRIADELGNYALGLTVRDRGGESAGGGQ